MKPNTIFSAAALFVAPVCLVAQTEKFSVQEYIVASITCLNELADIMEKVTPATAEACMAELNELKPRIEEIKAAISQYNDEEVSEMLEMKGYEEKLLVIIERITDVTERLQNELPGAAPEEQERVLKIAEIVQGLLE